MISSAEISETFMSKFASLVRASSLGAGNRFNQVVEVKGFEGVLLSRKVC